MKRWLIFALALATLSAPAPKPANYDAFGFALLQKLAPQAKNQNIFISPLSIGMALSMAADGARGQTRAAIANALGFSTGAFAPANSSLIAGSIRPSSRPSRLPTRPLATTTPKSRSPMPCGCGKIFRRNPHTSIS